MNIARSIESHAESFPDKTAIVYEGERISYLELERKINRVANGLLSLGINRGDVVAIMLPNIPEFIYLFYACQKIGSIAVPINTMYKANEVLHILKDSAANAIVCLSNFMPSINELLPVLPSLKNVLITGERSVVFADPEGTLFVQLIISQNKDIDVGTLYQQVGSMLLDALKSCGITNLEYIHRGGIRINGGRKVATVIIYEIENVLIVNAVVFINTINFNDYLSSLWVPPEIRDKIVEPISPINEILDNEISFNKIYESITVAFERKFDVSLREGSLTREEQFGYEKQIALSKRRHFKRISFWQKVMHYFLKKGRPL